MARRRRTLIGAPALAALVALLGVAGAAAQQGGRSGAAGGAGEETIARGEALFQEGCSSCHGLDARGVKGIAPDLHGVGARSADFYLSTGRMPLDKPGDEPVRSQPRYPRDEIDAIVAYIGSLGGPPVPEVDIAAGDLNEGFGLFTTHCAGCHQAVARGGIVTGAFAPDLGEATPTQVAEALRTGPYLMPRFGEKTIDSDQLNSLVAYVESTKQPVDEGGWGIGNLGPIPEGMVAWFLAIVVLLVVARVIGERTASRPEGGNEGRER